MNSTVQSGLVGTVQLRWLLRRDLADVLAIERASSEHPWGEDEFVHALRQRHTIGIAADAGERIVGFMIYGLYPQRIDLIELAVDPAQRRRGIGGRMIAKLVGKLSAQHRSRLVVDVRESNLPAQLFLRSRGFRAEGIVRACYRDSAEDGYRFVHHAPPVDNDGTLPIP